MEGVGTYRHGHHADLRSLGVRFRWPAATTPQRGSSRQSYLYGLIQTMQGFSLQWPMHGHIAVSFDTNQNEIPSSLALSRPAPLKFLCSLQFSDCHSKDRKILLTWPCIPPRKEVRHSPTEKSRQIGLECECALDSSVRWAISREISECVRAEKPWSESAHTDTIGDLNPAVGLLLLAI